VKTARHVSREIRYTSWHNEFHCQFVPRVAIDSLRVRATNGPLSGTKYCGRVNK
jgi:hypothetical protein